MRIGFTDLRDLMGFEIVVDGVVDTDSSDEDGGFVGGHPPRVDTRGNKKGVICQCSRIADGFTRHRLCLYVSESDVTRVSKDTVPHGLVTDGELVAHTGFLKLVSTWLVDCSVGFTPCEGEGDKVGNTVEVFISESRDGNSSL